MFENLTEINFPRLYILNVFTIQPHEVTSPLLKLSVIRILMDKQFQTRDAEATYMTAKDLQDYFEPCGIARRVLKHAIEQLLRYRLIEPYDPTD
jgi:hypothetical protein